MDNDERLGVALSGGGHRAAVFSLGALLYMVDARVSPNVTTISSVSGGSLLNGYLALQRTRRLIQGQLTPASRTAAR